MKQTQHSHVSPIYSNIESTKNASPQKESSTMDDCTPMECSTSEAHKSNVEPSRKANLIDAPAASVSKITETSTSNTSHTSNSATIDLSSFPANLSTDHENIDHEIECKLLRKMQCYSLELLQNVTELLQSETTMTKANSDDSNFDSVEMPLEAPRSVPDNKDKCGEPGPSQ